jgi:hypothetical protein
VKDASLRGQFFFCLYRPPGRFFIALKSAASVLSPIACTDYVLFDLCGSSADVPARRWRRSCFKKEGSCLKP